MPGVFRHRGRQGPVEHTDCLVRISGAACLAGGVDPLPRRVLDPGLRMALVAARHGRRGPGATVDGDLLHDPDRQVPAWQRRPARRARVPVFRKRTARHAGRDEHDRGDRARGHGSLRAGVAAGAAGHRASGAGPCVGTSVAGHRPRRAGMPVDRGLPVQAPSIPRAPAGTRAVGLGARQHHGGQAVPARRFGADPARGGPVGASLATLATASVATITPSAIATSIAVFSAAWIAGFLAPGAPAGLGVREAILLAGLGPLFGAATAVEVAIFFRVLSVAADLVAPCAGSLLLRAPGRRVPT